jgi:hypothetical protein
MWSPLTPGDAPNLANDAVAKIVRVIPGRAADDLGRRAPVLAVLGPNEVEPRSSRGSPQFDRIIFLIIMSQRTDRPNRDLVPSAPLASCRRRFRAVDSARASR